MPPSLSSGCFSAVGLPALDKGGGAWSAPSYRGAHYGERGAEPGLTACARLAHACYQVGRDGSLRGGASRKPDSPVGTRLPFWHISNLGSTRFFGRLASSWLAAAGTQIFSLQKSLLAQIRVFHDFCEPEF